MSYYVEIMALKKLVDKELVILSYLTIEILIINTQSINIKHKEPHLNSTVGKSTHTHLPQSFMFHFWDEEPAPQLCVNLCSIVFRCCTFQFPDNCYPIDCFGLRIHNVSPLTNLPSMNVVC